MEITGYDPSETRIGNWELHQIGKELKESIKLDPSTILTMLMLDSFTEEYLNQKNFTVNSIISDFDGMMAYLSKSRDLYAILRSEALQNIRKDFESHMLLSLKQYGEIPEEVTNTVKNPHHLAFLRRDALKSMQTLTVAQFAQGEPSKEPHKFMEHVLEFWNINSLIQMAVSTKENFISLDLIRDPDYYNSYFVFVVKNGGTVSIVCDKPDWVHPLQKNMVRRPERRFAERAFKNHFPYALMDLEYDEDQRALYLRQKSESLDLVPHQKDIYKIKKIKNLHPFEVIWTTMMFQLIKEKFLKENFQAPEICYTGEMVTVNHDRGKELILPHRLVVPAFTASDVRPENTREQWGYKPTGQHDWLEKRYEKQIPDEILTLTGVGDGVVKLIAEDNLSEVKTTTAKELEGNSWRVPSWKRRKSTTITGISPTEFGTKDQLLRDMQWNARYNKARAVKMLADKEYDERKDKIIAWYRKKVENNADALLEAVARNKMIAWSEGYASGFGVAPDVLGNILHFVENEFSYSMKACLLHGGLDGHFRCYLKGTVASIAAEFRPTTAHGIATICGCKVSELPDVIRNWRKNDLYAGNSILNRVDPMEWVVKDPWRQLSFDARIYLSIRGYAGLCKKYGTEPVAKRFHKTEAEKVV